MEVYLLLPLSLQSTDSESRSGDSYGRNEVKTEVALRRKKKKKDEDTDFVFLDRRSIALDLDDAKKYPEARQLMRQETFPDPHKGEADYDHLSERTQELSLSSASKQSSSQTSSKVQSAKLCSVVGMTHKFVKH